MDNLLKVIERPLITERATNLKAEANQYVFRVALAATKPQIRDAVEKLFKVAVLDVQTMRVHGKYRRMGQGRGAYRADWKKAVVRLKTGQEIRVGEEVK